MFEFLNDIGNYDSRKIKRTDVNGVTVSTADSSDEGYETAIIDVNGVHPVERYSSKKAAISGHEHWCKKAETIKVITKLGGFGGVVGDSIINIVRE